MPFSNGEPEGPVIEISKYLKLSSYGWALIPGGGSTDNA